MRNAKNSQSKYFVNVKNLNLLIISFRTGETQIINDEPQFQPEELAKDGIHMVTIEETSQLGIDEASQMSMNEPLIFNRPNKAIVTSVTTLPVIADMDIDDSNSHNIVERKPQVTVQQSQKIDTDQSPSPDVRKEGTTIKDEELDEGVTNDNETKTRRQEETDIPMPEPPTQTIESDIGDALDDVTSKQGVANTVEITTEIDLSDIPQPPPSPTESEKNRRQEELDDLAMLGIDADDMAAQCM